MSSSDDTCEAPPLVLVLWWDITGSAAWSDCWDDQGHMTMCQSVGWLTRHDDEVLVLAGSVIEPNDPSRRATGGITTMPTGCVIQVIEMTTK